MYQVTAKSKQHREWRESIRFFWFRRARTLFLLVGAVSCWTGPANGQDSIHFPDARLREGVQSAVRSTASEHPETRPPGCEKCDPVADSWSNNAEVVGCADCHYGGPQKNPLAKQRRLGSFSRQFELKIWLEQDKHAVARRRIEPLTKFEFDSISEYLREEYQLQEEKVGAWVGESNRLSRTICDKLGFDVDTDEGYLCFRDNCLTCHGGYAYGSDEKGFSSRLGFRQAGVSCNYCHQQGDNDEWVDKHRRPKTWRLLTPSQKAVDGMRDLVSMTSQARLCNDCHIGNVAQHQFVSHEMYAAGHPPLPAFELQTFSQRRHWQSPSELHSAMSHSPKDRDTYFAAYYPRLFSEGFSSVAEADRVAWNTRKILTGAIQSRRHALNLLADSAEAKRWGDFALYDCSACHHALRSVSRRQQRGFPGTPGRPREAVWPHALLNQGLQTVVALDALDQLQNQLDTAFGEQPFGNPRVVGPAARQAANELDRAQEHLDAVRMDSGNARLVLARLADSNEGDLLEYDSARNIVWSIQQISGELDRLQSPLPEHARRTIANLGMFNNARLLQTGLPSRQGEFIYPDFLQSELERRSRYLDALQGDGAYGQATPAFLKSQLQEIRSAF